MTVRFRPFLAGDAVQIALQPSQHVTLGLSRPVLGIEDGRDLEEHGDAWTAYGADGRLLCCAGFRELWPANVRSGGHAIAWALLTRGLGPAHVAITRFARRAIADSPLQRIEAIVRAGVAAECNWARLVGLRLRAELPCWGPDGEDHLLFDRIRPCVGGPASPQPGQPSDAGTAHARLREECR